MQRPVLNASNLLLSQGLLFCLLVFSVPTLAAMEQCSLEIGHPLYCTECGPCTEGQGGCKGDDQCTDGLICAENIGVSFDLAPTADVCLTPRSLPANFTFHEIPEIIDPDGNFSTFLVAALNNHGQVVGTASRAGAPGHLSDQMAYRYTPGEGFETFDPTGELRTRGVAINNHGQIFGRVRPHGGNHFQDEVFVQTPGAGYDFLEIGSTAEIKKRFQLNQLSDHGFVLGSLYRPRSEAYVPTYPVHAAVYYSFEEGWVELVDFIPGAEESTWSEVYDANARGDLLFSQVRTFRQDRLESYVLFAEDGSLGRVGKAANRGAFAFDIAKNGIVAGADRRPLDFGTEQSRALVRIGAQNIDIHPRPFTASFAWKVTDKGVVVAEGNALAASEADTIFTWDPRRERKIRVELSRADFRNFLPEEASEIYAIYGLRVNERLEVIGRLSSFTPDGQNILIHFYYSPATGLVDLESFLEGEEKILDQVADFNDQGQILLRLVTGSGLDVVYRSVILTPMH